MPCPCEPFTHLPGCENDVAIARVDLREETPCAFCARTCRGEVCGEDCARRLIALSEAGELS